MQAKVDPAVHYLFRLAKYEEGNADKWLLRTARPKRPELLKIADRMDEKRGSG